MDVNKIRDSGDLALVNYPKLDMLALDYEDDRAQSQEVTWVWKLQASYLNTFSNSIWYLAFKSKKRLFGEKMKEMFGKRYIKPEERQQDAPVQVQAQQDD